MADKKKASKALDKKAMKKTKGGIIAVVPAVQHDISIRQPTSTKVSPGQINGCDGSV